MDHEQHLGLLKKVAVGDRAAFQKLYEATSAQLYAVSLKIMQNRDLAEDALQEAFIRIWHNAQEYTPAKGKVLTWMISIVRYRCFDALRFNKVRQGNGLEQEEVLTSDDFVELTEIEKKQLDFCMDELESKQKQAIHLAFFGGLTHQEVSAHINSPLGSSKSLIRRGMQSLRRCLGL
ncbi:sigma-70 family RNA polymerase sigma factor [Aliiglaciecola lipolytica]|uniref:RNA polymerase sigma-70 factor, ECF subfamily n=1 Tax=Aliiglaciecola lipolytica E3 TaxID=1127673 RepID=K6YCT1_9ALTE|nr:sigma-70 family RNA polymerase sigma factor [Aliiglaciecola lipolytica]GAC16002.1 RNA polymerase sigma-70 factor, ECF subfamily [Aliiglaciecola lipolytica E3]